MARTSGRDRSGGDRPTKTKTKTLTRPDLCEAQRLRAADLFAQGRAPAEVATMVGVTYEAARRWRARWREGGVEALGRRTASGRPPKLSDAKAEAVRQALLAGAQAAGYDTDLWTLGRVVQVIQRTTGVRLSRPSAWRLLTGRLGWSLQRPERQAKERDEQAIARWVAHEWPRIKKGPPKSPHG
jgi:transposase